MEKKVKMPKRVAGLATQRFTRLQGWVALAEVKPRHADRPVILFSPRLNKLSFEGHPIMVSNPKYARFTATKEGWTHWTDVPWPYPRRQPPKKVS